MKKIVLSFVFALCVITSALSAPFLLYARNTKNGGPLGYNYTNKVHVVVWPWEFVDIQYFDPGTESCPK
jgi:hypothetical protein